MKPSEFIGKRYKEIYESMKGFASPQDCYIKAIIQYLDNKDECARPITPAQYFELAKKNCVNPDFSISSQNENKKNIDAVLEHDWEFSKDPEFREWPKHSRIFKDEKTGEFFERIIAIKRENGSYFIPKENGTIEVRTIEEVLAAIPGYEFYPDKLSDPVLIRLNSIVEAIKKLFNQ